MGRSRTSAVQGLTAAFEFLGSTRGGLVVLEGLADLAVLSEWAPTLEVAVRLRHVARSTGSTVIVSTSHLTDSERRGPPALSFSWLWLPAPADEYDGVVLP